LSRRSRWLAAVLFLLVACEPAVDDDDDATDDDDDAAGFTWHADLDGDGFGGTDVAASTETNEAPEGLIADGSDCDDADPHLFPSSTYTSGLQRQCAPAVYPGVQETWHEGRVEQPFVLQDGDDCYLYFRAHSIVERHAIGVVKDEGCTGGYSTVDDNAANPVLEARALAEWDGRNVSNPTVVYVPTMARPYLMFFHAKDGSSRKVGLATATDPMGPFDRLDGDGAPLLTPVIDLGAVAEDLDSRQVHHPVALYDGSLIHLWYTARTLSGGTFATVYATSADGVSWTKYDDLGTAAFPEPVLETTPGAFDSDRVTAPGVLLNSFDPEGGYALMHWWTGDRVVTGETLRSLGVGHGSATSIEQCGAVLEVADYPAIGSHSVAGQGLMYVAEGVGAGPDYGTLHLYYGATGPLDANTYPGDADYENPTGNATFVAHATNPAPRITVDFGDGDTVSGTVSGTVEDTAPDTVLVGVEFVAIGAASADAWLLATVDATGNTDAGIQSTTYAVEVTPPAGTYDLLVHAEDEGCSRRTVRITDVTVE
jgi:hypothetical protein